MIEDEERERRSQRPISYSATKQLIEDEERERREKAERKPISYSATKQLIKDEEEKGN